MPEIDDIMPEGEIVALSRLEQMAPILEKIMQGEMCLSYSALQAFIDSPKDFADYKLGEKVQTKAMIYGSMVHCLVLEPAAFDNRYYAVDDTDICEQIGGAKPRATKQYKQWMGEHAALAGNRILVKPQDYKNAKAVAYLVRTNRASSRLLHACPQRERGIEWEYLNFRWRGFIDMEGDKDIADLKTMPNANRDIVDREIKKRRLYIQAVMYGMGAKALAEKAGKVYVQKNHHVIAVDKKGGISVHTFDKRLLEYGMEEMEYYVKKFNHAYISEAWDQSQDFYGHPYTGTFRCEKSGYMLSAEF